MKMDKVGDAIIGGAIGYFLTYVADASAQWKVVVVITAAVIGVFINWLAERESRRGGESEPKGEEFPPQGEYPSKLTIHVILPTNRNGFKDTLGDGLLQAAGFMAASDVFENVKIVPHDHQNNSDKAWEILEEILNKEAPLGNPICVIFTMSSICQKVFKKCKENIVKYSSSVKNRLSIVFTVASAPETPHDGVNFYQHFVSGDIETDAIVKHCHSSILNYSRNEQYIPRGLLFVMKSPYSKETTDKIKGELENNISFVRIELNANDELANDHRERIKRFIAETKIEERFAIIIAYDTALLRSIEALSQDKYEGVVIAATTLSVKDWQEYLNSENYWDPNKTNVFYTELKDLILMINERCLRFPWKGGASMK